MILESQGHQEVTAVDGVEGLANLKSETPDLMILDLMMPKMDGFAVLKTLQDGRWSKYRNTPIIILSSVREEAGRRRYELETGLDLGAEDYLEKPLNPDVLIDIVNKALNRHR
jgi:two-component system alkaline phosphatase synthesis response regulator PhoP